MKVVKYIALVAMKVNLALKINMIYHQVVLVTS